MLNAWVSFAATGDPGRQPINDSTSSVQTWGSSDSPSPLHTAGIRELWHHADFPLLRP
ncbi:MULTISPECIES: hypothetical protein [unclassified Streptomyces]|uniref:hypothetical protein n=1 Tax=unclassified Streptomyces TaxID=2593676 RepID=UPI002DDB22D3|nr:hypothetical protein [Streptomyces sp. NBC_01760]